MIGFLPRCFRRKLNWKQSYWNWNELSHNTRLKVIFDREIQLEVPRRILKGKTKETKNRIITSTVVFSLVFTAVNYRIIVLELPRDSIVEE